MNWLARLWASLWDWFARRGPDRALVAIPSAAPRSHQYCVVHVDDEPDQLDPERLYAVGEAGHLWHMSMLCPCTCGARIQLNALADAWPRWTLDERDGVPSIRPSVWRQVGCRSHFFLRAGSIEWCGA